MAVLSEAMTEQPEESARVMETSVLSPGPTEYMPQKRAQDGLEGVLIDDGSPGIRVRIKEAARLAYVSGRAKLVHLSARHRIPLETIQRWSHEDGWGEVRSQTLAIADERTATKVADWLVAEREGQIRAILDEAKAARELLASVRAEGDTYFHPETGVIRGPIGATGAAKLAGAGKAIAETVMQALGIGNQAGKGGTTINVQAVGAAMIVPPE